MKTIVLVILFISLNEVNKYGMGNNPSPVWEIVLLNREMNEVGIHLNTCELRFYTYNIVYAVKFGPSGAFNIEKFSRFFGQWELVCFSGTLNQTTTTLNSFGPFLTWEQVIQYWGGLELPPEPLATDFEEIEMPV